MQAEQKKSRQQLTNITKTGERGFEELRRMFQSTDADQQEKSEEKLVTALVQRKSNIRVIRRRHPGVPIIRRSRKQQDKSAKDELFLLQITGRGISIRFMFPQIPVHSFMTPRTVSIEQACA